jgi:Pyruvate/2-oxoacid:ferredoxin oxidoreductase gamma subunit
VGLTITFLGIVAALTQATSTMSSNGGSAAMQQALLGLLAIAATKFWSSIAGVASSIILRLTARQWRLRIERVEAEFFAALDGVVIFAPPEKVALEQAAVLRRIEAALTAPAQQRTVPATELSA